MLLYDQFSGKQSNDTVPTGRRVFDELLVSEAENLYGDAIKELGLAYLFH
jgi:hypothetical protein